MLVASVYLLLPVRGNDVVPPNPEFLQWTHLPSWYVVVGLARLAPTFFDNYTVVLVLLLFGLQATVYAVLAFSVTRGFRRRGVS
jgi:hypothetical protein